MRCVSSIIFGLALGIASVNYAKEDLEYHAPLDLASFDKIIGRTYLSDQLPVLTAVLFVETGSDFKTSDHSPENLASPKLAQLQQQFKQAQMQLDFVDLVLVDLSLNDLGRLKTRYHLAPEHEALTVPVISLFKARAKLPAQRMGFPSAAEIVRFIKRQLGPELRQLARRYLKSSAQFSNATRAITSANTKLTYRAQNTGWPHYYPQPYLGGLHAFGTPYRMDFFYPYYGPKFRL